MAFPQNGDKLAPVIHVKSLNEAISIYAAARVSGQLIPTFVTTLEEWPTFMEDTAHSYTIEHVVIKPNGKEHTITMNGVMILVSEGYHLDGRVILKRDVHQIAPSLQ